MQEMYDKTTLRLMKITDSEKYQGIQWAKIDIVTSIIKVFLFAKIQKGEIIRLMVVWLIKLDHKM